MGILLAIVFNAFALWATTFVPGIVFRGNVLTLLLGGAILGLFNLIVRPLAMIISLPLLILTLGLFYFVLNGILLWLVSLLIPGYVVQGLVPGILGALVITIINWVLGALVGGKK
jgi:putative membrane protein